MESARSSLPSGLLLPGLALLLLPFSFPPGARGQTVEVLQSPKSVSVAAGEQVTLTCTVTVTSGLVNGPVRWFKGSGDSRTLFYSYSKDKKVSSSRISRAEAGTSTDFSIIITNITTADTGTYYCVKYHQTIDKENEFKSGGGTDLSVNENPPAPRKPNQEDFQYYVIAACLVLLLLLVLAVVIFMRTKKKRDKHTANRRSMHSSRPDQALDTKDITYADLEFQQRRPNGRSAVAQNDHCVYASVQGATQPQKDNLTYADLDTVRLNQGPRKAAARPAEDSSEYAEVQIRKP